MSPVAVRDLDLDLDAFQGPFDLLLTLVLRDELELADVEVAEIILAFVERLVERTESATTASRDGRDRLDLDGCGEFLVLVASLLDLKARELFPDELAGEELDPEEAAEELAERLATYRRFRAAAAWLRERLASESERYFRVGPAPLAPVPARPLPRHDPGELASALRRLAVEPAAPSLDHLGTFPPIALFLARFRAALRRRRRFVFDREVEGLSRIEQAVAFVALLELCNAREARLRQLAPFEPITVWRES